MAMYMQNMQTVAFTASSPTDMPNMTPSYPSCAPWEMRQDQSPTMAPQPMPHSPTMSPCQSPQLAPMSPSPMPSTCMGNSWDMQSAPKAETTTVLLKGLPNGMCASSAYMEVVLDEAGLDGTIVEIKVTQGSPCGKAVIKFNNWNAAAHCIRHFSGCVWDEAGMPVSACFAKSKTSMTSSTSKRERTFSEGIPTPAAPAAAAAAAPVTPIRAAKEGSRKTPKAPIANKPQLAAPEASSKMTRPTLAKQNTNEDSDGSAGGSTRGSTRSSLASLSPQSRPLWADIVSDDED